MRLATYMISVPLILGATQMVQPVTVANAAPLTPVQATQLLAKANTINIKCSLLAEDQSQGLKDLLARAEISLAERLNVAAARKAIAAGRAEGKAGLCGENARKLVSEVYAAASTAVAIAVEPVAEAKVAKPLAASEEPDDVALSLVKETVEKKPRTRALAVAKQQTLKKPAIAKMDKQIDQQAVAKKPEKPAKALGTYAVVAERYYVALKCGGMGAGKLNKLYKSVLAEHQSAMSANKARDVRAMLRAAEARAGSKNCG